MARTVLQVRRADGGDVVHGAPVVVLVRVRGPVDYPAGAWLPRMRRGAVWAARPHDRYGRPLVWPERSEGHGWRTLHGWRLAFRGPRYVVRRVSWRDQLTTAER